jgi:hypothetical protein
MAFCITWFWSSGAMTDTGNGLSWNVLSGFPNSIQMTTEIDF